MQDVAAIYSQRKDWVDMRKNVFPETKKAGDLSLSDGGLTLHQLYSGMAMQGILSNRDEVKGLKRDAKKMGIVFSQLLAHCAARAADDLIHELETLEKDSKNGN